jgi:hypothetical protein
MTDAELEYFAEVEGMGYDAFHTRLANPYPLGTPEHAAWQAGYDSARQEFRASYGDCEGCGGEFWDRGSSCACGAEEVP